MSTDPTPHPEPEVQPSSTPDGPQIIPTHGTPEGEPGPDPDRSMDFDNRSSNPNSGGDLGLSGDMGVSSERTGPAGAGPREGGIAGTGSKGSAVTDTDGTFDTSPTEWDAVDVSQRDVQTQPVDDYPHDDDPQNVDRTVGEPRPQPIADEKSRR